MPTINNLSLKVFITPNLLIWLVKAIFRLLRTQPKPAKMLSTAPRKMIVALVTCTRSAVPTLNCGYPLMSKRAVNTESRLGACATSKLKPGNLGSSMETMSTPRLFVLLPSKPSLCRAG